MDETYQIYVNRVARLTLPATYQTQLPNIHKSPKFEDGKAVSFPGYTIITPPQEEDVENQEFYTQLNKCQQDLLEKFEPGLMIPVPPESFHITVADLIWNHAYHNAVDQNPQFEVQLKDCIAQSFKQYQESGGTTDSIQLQLLGLTIYPRALAVCLVPKDEQSYERILQFRRSIYQNPDLIALGIEQQYYFTAHITLGYFGEISDNLDRDHIANILTKFNDQWLETEPQFFQIQRAELRKFDDMMSYDRESDWPVLNF